MLGLFLNLITIQILSFLLVLLSLPVFIFANQSGLDMLETTLVALQDITLDKIFDDSGHKGLFSEFAKIMQQVLLRGEKHNLCYRLSISFYA